MKTNRHDFLDYILIAIAAIYNLSLMVFTLLWLFTNNFKAYKDGFTSIAGTGVNEAVSYGLFFSGVLGGTFYCLRGLYQRLGEAYTSVEGVTPNPSQILNIKVWFFWYLYRPLQGGCLALIILSLLSSNLLTVKNIDVENLKSFYTYIALGIIAGFGSHEVIRKIEELIQVLFAKAKNTTTNSESKVKENKGS